MGGPPSGSGLILRASPSTIPQVIRPAWRLIQPRTAGLSRSPSGRLCYTKAAQAHIPKQRSQSRAASFHPPAEDTEHNVTLSGQLRAPPQPTLDNRRYGALSAGCVAPRLANFDVTLRDLTLSR